jgi:DNA-binding FrmR family transcriptional regulator
MQETQEKIAGIMKFISYCLEVGQYQSAVKVAKNSAMTEWLLTQCKKIIRDYVEQGQSQLLRIFVADMGDAWPEKREDLISEVVSIRIESCKL